MFTVAILLTISAFVTKIAPADDCSTCRNLISNFIRGLDNTASGSFSGGNTLWEEKKLIDYAVSETRFHSVIDNVCDKSQFQCQKVLHEVEPLLDEWWTKVFRKTGKVENIEEEICIEGARLCCPANSYGKACLPCLPCSFFGGHCDGNGTRSGDGSCICRTGYTGVNCDTCNTQTHFQSSSSTDDVIVCERCHSSCEGGCDGPTASDCKACAKGWFSKPSDVGSFDCVDVNECESDPCMGNQYCKNTEGSYECRQCSVECDGCSGPTNENCLKCSQGFTLIDGRCEDINECEAEAPPCSRPGEVCLNKKGGYQCDCKIGWSKVQGLCKPKDATGKYGRKSGGRASVSQRDSKVIWTVAFAKEMTKYIGSLFAFVAFCWIAKGHSFLIPFSGFILGVYIYYQSIQLDSTFKNQS